MSRNEFFSRVAYVGSMVCYLSTAVLLLVLLGDIFANGCSVGRFFQQWNVVKLAVAVGGMGIYLSRISKRFELANGEPVFDAEAPFVLLLRSFRDDGADVQAHRFPFFMTGERPVTLEEIVAERTASVGKMVKLRNARRLPDLGSISVAAEEHEWRERVRALANRSRLVVVLSNDSSALTWEIGELITHGLLNKTVVLLQVSKGRAAARTMATQWASLRKTLLAVGEKYCWLQKLPTEWQGANGAILALTFPGKGVVCCHRLKKRWFSLVPPDWEDYQRVIDSSLGSMGLIAPPPGNSVVMDRGDL